MSAGRSLYTQSEIKKIRDELVKEQRGIDPILKEPFKETIVCDHDHSSQHVRAALNRNSNAFEGLVFNAYRRCLQWLTDVPLPDILRNLANYLEEDYSHHPYHIGWMKRVKTDFNKLNSKQMKQVLEALGKSDGKNLVDRKKIFANIILDRSLGYECIKIVLDKAKEIK